MSDEVNKVPVYAEPEGIDYIIIKVKESVINGDRGGNLYETTRRAWRAKLETAMPYRYVLSVVGGVVQEVYSVSRWYTSPEYAPRIEFEGEVAEFKIRNLFVGKMIPECYRQKGLASPFLYKKKAGGAVAEPAQEETSEADALKAAALKKAEEAAIKAKAEAQAQAAAAAALAKAEAEAKAKAEAEAKAKAEAEAKAKAEAEAKAKAEAEAKAKAEAEAKAKAEAEAKAKAEAEAKAKAEAEAKAKAEAEAKVLADSIKCTPAHDNKFEGKIKSGQTLYFRIIPNQPQFVETVPQYDGMWIDEPTGELEIPSSVVINGKQYSVTTIGKHSFNNCKGLTSLVTPDTVGAIGDYAFMDCTGIKSINLPGVFKIGNASFQGCKSLETISFPKIASIGTLAFNDCGMKALVIPNSLNQLGEESFSKCRYLAKISLSSTLKEIPQKAFYDCDNLETVLIPDGVTHIGHYAFDDCGRLSKVIIPKSVVYIGYRAFYYTNINKVIIPNTNIEWGKVRDEYGDYVYGAFKSYVTILH